MARGSFSLGRAFGDGWQGFSANAGTAIGGLVVWMIVAMVLSIIPFINFAYSLLLAGPMTGGLMLLSLNLHKRSASFGDIFGGFKKFGTYLGVYWLLVLISILCMVPGAIVGAAVWFASSGEEDMILVAVGAGALLSAIIMWVVYLRFLFAYYVVADDWEDSSITRAFSKSSMITEGNRLKLFGCMIVLGLFMMLGYLVLLVGALITVPVTMVAMASIYTQLKESAGGEGLDAQEA